MGKGQGQTTGGQACRKTSLSPPFWPLLLVLFALAWGAGPQLPRQDHTFRVVKTPGPGVALENELKSPSYEDPGSETQVWLACNEVQVQSQA